MRGIGNTAEQVIAYETFDNGKPPRDIVVGFADGHVALMQHARFEQLLAQSKARNGVQ